MLLNVCHFHLHRHRRHQSFPQIWPLSIYSCLHLGSLHPRILILNRVKFLSNSRFEWNSNFGNTGPKTSITVIVLLSISLNIKFSDAGIQDVSTSISIMVKFEEMTDDDNENEDESDKHLEARDCRYSCLKCLQPNNFQDDTNARVLLVTNMMLRLSFNSRQDVLWRWCQMTTHRAKNIK